MANDPQDSESTESRELDRVPNDCAEIVNRQIAGNSTRMSTYASGWGMTATAMSCALRGWMSTGGAPRRRLPKS